MDHIKMMFNIYCCILVLSLIQAKPLNNNNNNQNNNGKRGNPKYRGLGREEFLQMENCVKNLKVQMARDAGNELNIETITDTLIDDIAVTNEQCQQMTGNYHNQKGTNNGRNKRKALNFSLYSGSKWTLPISYYVNSTYFSDATEKVIDRAFALWQERTCLRFIKRDATYTDKHIEVQGESTGCWSYLGKTKNNPQIINVLEAGCTGLIGIPIHEIGHAMGLIHEQSRPDRDDYVTINYNNIQQGREANFNKLTETVISSLGVPYDFSSVMQYDRGAFSKNGGLTINSKIPEYKYTIGQRNDASFMDLLMMNRAYQCYAYDGVAAHHGAPAACKNPSITCYNGGYVDPGIKSNCNTCRCPAGLKGDCTVAADGTEGTNGCNPLSGNIDVKSTTETCLRSPNFNKAWTTYYSYGSSCSWLLKAPTGNKIALRFNTDTAPFGVYSSHYAPAKCFHWVEIKYNGNLTTTGTRFCGDASRYMNQYNTVQSAGEEVLIDFRSDYPAPSSRMTRGFELCYRLVFG